MTQRHGLPGTHQKINLPFFCSSGSKPLTNTVRIVDHDVQIIGEDVRSHKAVSERKTVFKIMRRSHPRSKGRDIFGCALARLSTGTAEYLLNGPTVISGVTRDRVYLPLNPS